MTYYYCWECGPTRSKQGTKTLKIEAAGYYYSVICFHPDCVYNEGTFMRPSKVKGLVGEIPKEIPTTFLTHIDEAIPRPPLGEGEVDYDYRDIKGRLLFIIRRFPDKTFLPLSMSVSHEWQIKRPKIKALYGAEMLPISPDSPVLVLEGEKAADYARATLFRKHFIPVTWPGGATNVDQGDWDLIKNRTVILWPDNDAPGLEAMNIVHNYIFKGNKVFMVSVKDFPKKSDICDFTVEDVRDILGVVSI